MKYITIGYTCNESVQYRNDYRAIKIGNDRVPLCEAYSKELKDTPYQDRLAKSIYLYNQTMYDLS